MMDDIRSLTKMDGSIGLDFKRAIENYKPSYKAWPFKYGDDILPIMGASSSFYITHYLRKELKIRPYARYTCYAPVVGISCLMIDMCHTYFINPEIITGSFCAPCTLVKAALIQVTLGVGYPLILGPLVTFNTADRLLTYPVPSLIRAPYEVYNLWSKMLQKNAKAFLISAAIQVTGTLFVTWQKQEFLWEFINER